jgi:N-acetylneuraminate synthase/N,N'-diacetyllegionaminate synthase
MGCVWFMGNQFFMLLFSNGGVMRAMIIAEVGINHGGDMGLALEMINMAWQCGADIVKFQLYDPWKLLNPKEFTPDDWAEIVKSELSFSDTLKLKNHCDAVGIEFMASAFDFTRLGWLEILQVKRHKIASRSIYDVGYCQQVIETRKPYIVSDGWLGFKNPLNEKIDKTLKRLGIHEDKKCSFLYCISKYPTPLEDINFKEDDFTDYYDGFSDHTVGITASITALALGAQIIEKHFTLDRALPGPDQAGSATPEELQALCSYRDELYKMKGDGL